MIPLRALILSLVVFSLIPISAPAQTSPTTASTRPARAPQPLTRPSDTIADDDAGYESIFDGKTLNGWEGDPKYWRVENGCLVGEVTPETILKRNTFII